MTGNSDRHVTVHKTRFYVSHNLELLNIFCTDRIQLPHFGRQFLSHHQSHGMKRLYSTPWGDLFHDMSFVSGHLIHISYKREKRGIKEPIFFRNLLLDWNSSVHEL